MGIITSRDTRRISFDNNFSFNNSALAVTKSIEDENIMDFEKIAAETTEELIFSDNNKCCEPQEEGDGDYWLHRIDNLKKEHQIINKILESEYDKQLESTSQIYQPVQITHERIQKIKPCFDWRAKIIKCYEENPHQPLVCSSVVQAFANCVASYRLEDK